MFTIVTHQTLMISAPETSFSLKNINILSPKVTKILQI